jgi:hypothetical protein
MKAFEIMECKWLEKYLEKFEFGVHFREWVKTLLKNAKTRIITNGFIFKDVTNIVQRPFRSESMILGKSL